MSFRSKPLLSLALLLALPACPSAYDQARKEDTPDGYRRFLHENPGDSSTEMARGRLSELEFEHARRQHTVLGYKRFLADFPSSSRAKDAQVLLEGLRFEAAGKDGSSRAWLEFLRDHPNGAHSAEAKAKLDQADFKAACAEPRSQALDDYLARHPDSPQRAEAERLLDDRRIGEARAAGPRGLAAYLEQNPSGRYRDEARALLASRDALARAQLGDFLGAARRAELITAPQTRAQIEEQIARLELEHAASTLDPRELLGFALKHDGTLAQEARKRAQALGGERGPSKELRLLAERLDPRRFARPEAELIQVLAAPDPRDRWLAAEELGRIGALSAAEKLLDAVATSRFARVREHAFQALRRIYEPLPADALDLEARERIEELRKVAEGAQLHLKLAVLDELVGNPKAALGDYEKALRANPGDTFALRRLAELRRRQGEAFGAAVAARELATRVEMLVDARSSDEGLSPLLLSRTLCGARDEAKAALDLLGAMPEPVAADFTEDRALFERRAQDALRSAEARLADAEAKARWADRGFRGCEDDGEQRARLDEGDSERLEAVGEAAAKRDERLRPVLERLSRRDPSKAVREAARTAIEPTKKGE